MPFIPYAIGAFMLLPFAIWAGLFMVFPGPKPGITDTPMIAALVAVSFPLALFHYIAALGYVANSMAGRAGEELPVWGPARALQRAMAPLSVALALAAMAWLFISGESLFAVAAVGMAGLFMSAIMAVARRPRPSAIIMAAPGKLLLSSVFTLSAWITRLPVIGALWRELAANPHRAAPLVVMNTTLGLTLIVLLFGFSALVVPAMIAAPLIFFLMMSLAAD